MNKCFLMGRLTDEPKINVMNNERNTVIGRYTLAVERRYSGNAEKKTDFISCTVFGKGAEFAEKYLHKGTKIIIVGRIQTGSYVNAEGNKVYTTEVIVEEQEFAESKKSGENYSRESEPSTGATQSPAGQPLPASSDFQFASDDELPF